MVAREAGSARGSRADWPRQPAPTGRRPRAPRLTTKATTYVVNALSFPRARGAPAELVRLALALGELFEVREQLGHARQLARLEGGRADAVPRAGNPEPVVDEVAV